MVEPRFRWNFPEAVEPSASAVSAAAAHAIPTRLATLLAARGVVTGDDLIAWFADPLEGLHDPARLPDADLLLDRVRLARERGERILVFGDFDADGLTGLAIMTLALRRFGVAVEPYVPSRLDEGHGLSIQALDAAVATGSTLIITVDCGTTSVAEVAAANERGLDVIVTDHHRVPAILPAAIAIVNPHRPDSTYPDRRLAGSGVAFKVAQLLLADEPGGPAAALDLTDLATIGSVADVAPVVGENRAIARLGLERLRRAPRPGIAALLEKAHIAPDAVDLETVAFAIAPRLNAAGRVGEALEAARLLLAEDPLEAASHADALEAANLTRRDLMKSAVAEARAVVGDGAGASAIVVRGPWSVGIVGTRRGPPGRGARAARPSSAPSSAMSSGHRAGAMARSTSGRRSNVAGISSRGSAGTPGPPGSSSRPSAGTRSASASCSSPTRPRRRTRASRSRSIWPCPRRTWTTRSTGSSRGLRRAGPATRIRSWRSSA